MEEVVKFLRLLYKYRIIMITVPLVTVICTALLVRNMPNEYQATAQLATGLVDDTKQSIISELNVMGDSKITQKFSNLVEMIKMKITMDQISYRLMLHDLQSPTPFRPNSGLMDDLTPDARKHAIEVYERKYRDREALDLNNPDQVGLNTVIESMGYDMGSINGNLNVYRAGTSDYITVEFTSENPELSAFVVNTVLDEFINYYNGIQKAKLNKDVNFLQASLATKLDSLKAKEKVLQDYKVKNNVLNLEEQSASIYSLILDYETRRAEAQRTIASLRGTIANIDAKFDPKDRQYIDSKITVIDQGLMAKNAERKALQDEYILNGFDENTKQQIDSLNQVIGEQANRSMDQYIVSPLATKQSLIQQKLQLQIQLDQTIYSMGSLNNRLAELNATYSKLVPHQAAVQAYMRDIEIASTEYINLLEQFNKAGLTAASSTELSQAQKAVPPQAKPSKKALLVALSLVASTFFCLVAFFVVFFFDTSIKVSSELASKTGIPVLGHLNILSDAVLDLKKMWTNPDTKDRRLFKDMLRSVRFETERELGTNKMLMITSLCRGEGKTVFALSLTYAFAMTGKRVLLIDGNFKDNSISKTLKTQNFLEDFLNDNNLSILTEGGPISVLGNRGGDTSLLELASEAEAAKKIQDLKASFDLVIVETAALKALNVSSEWAIFSDKIISVFEAGRRMSPNRRGNINYLMNLDDKFIGWVLNKIPGRYLTPLVDKSWLSRKT